MRWPSPPAPTPRRRPDAAGHRAGEVRRRLVGVAPEAESRSRDTDTPRQWPWMCTGGGRCRRARTSTAGARRRGCVLAWRFRPQGWSATERRWDGPSRGGAVRGPRGGKCRRRRRDHSGFPRGRRCARGAKPSRGCGRDRGPSRTSAPSPRTARDRRCIPAGSHGESELRRTSRTRDTRQPVPERVQEPALHHRGVGRPCSDRCTSWGRGRASRSAGRRTDSRRAAHRVLPGTPDADHNFRR